MGMYTELICVADIKKEYVESMKIIFDQSIDESWEILGLKSKCFKEFIKCRRYFCIPFMEYSFYLKPQLTNGNICIWCNLKNYDNEIEKFFEVVKEISYEIHCFKSKYEECEEYVDWLR